MEYFEEDHCSDPSSNSNRLSSNSNLKFQFPVPTSISNREGRDLNRESRSQNIIVSKQKGSTSFHQNNQSESLDTHHKRISLYKTEICRTFEETGNCKYGFKCQFAHSESELRMAPKHPRYKTEICKTFWKDGTCPYGQRCCFIHDENRSDQQIKLLKPSHQVKDQQGTETDKKTSIYSSSPIYVTSASWTEKILESKDHLMNVLDRTPGHPVSLTSNIERLSLTSNDDHDNEENSSDFLSNINDESYLFTDIFKLIDQ